MKRTTSQNKARNEMLNKAKAYGNKVSKKNVDGENSMPKITQSHHNSTNLPQSPSQQEDQLNMTQSMHLAVQSPDVKLYLKEPSPGQ